jgi:hypothetical protein
VIHIIHLDDQMTPRRGLFLAFWAGKLTEISLVLTWRSSRTLYDEWSMQILRVEYFWRGTWRRDITPRWETARGKQGIPLP